MSIIKPKPFQNQLSQNYFQIHIKIFEKFSKSALAKVNPEINTYN